MMTDHPELLEKARKIRRTALKSITNAGSGHPGGSLSATDIIAALFFKKLRHDPKNHAWTDRDRFILSKGHAAPALYAALSEAGYFEACELDKLRQCNAMLQGHPCAHTTPGVEVSTGSLGHGLAVGVGMALASRLDKKQNRVYVLMGDGELDEGEVWEAAMAASHYKLSNITAIIDRNRLQLDGETERIKSLEPLAEKWRAFGWHTLEIDGHDFTQILAAFDTAEQEKSRPTVIVARTVKGKGISFMENKVEFHGKPPTREQLELALKELA